MSRKVWKKYKVGEKSTRPNWTEQDCQPFSVVRHITHVKDAIRIVEDGLIRSSLVWDESKLNNTRTCVSWVSPNSWAYGSIYGNISFEYLWDELVKGKRFYWVEDYDRCNPTAYRIMLSEKDYSESDLVVPYPVEDGSGPIYYDGETWYRNGHYTGEFLIDDDLYVDECHEIRFERHHDRFCAKSGSGCRDIGLSEYKAGSRFISNIIGRDLKHMSGIFWDKSSQKKQLTFQAQGALGWVFRVFEKRSSDKDTRLSLKKRRHITRACLNALSENDTEFLDSVVKILGTQDEVSDILKRVVEKFFDAKFDDIIDW